MKKSQYIPLQRGSVSNVLFGLFALVAILYTIYHLYTHRFDSADKDCHTKYQQTITYSQRLNIFYSKALDKCVLYAITPDWSNPENPKTNIKYADPDTKAIYKSDELDGNLPDKDYSQYAHEQFEKFASK